MNKPISIQGETSNFVNFTIERCRQDDGLAAALRRADNPGTEYHSWEYLAMFTDLDHPAQRMPYATVAAAIAKSNAEHNGTTGIGRAIARCFEGDMHRDQGRVRLRRLLACDKPEEACRVLRPLLCLIENKAGIRLDYAGLLNDLLDFSGNAQKVKSRWAQDFYRRVVPEDVQ